MSIDVAGKLSKYMNRKCPSCKGPLGDSKKGWSVCEICLTKACTVCGKISIHGARLSTSGKPLCPRHYSAFIRMKEGMLNMHWKSDVELNDWVKNFQLEATKEMESQIQIFDDVMAESIIKQVEIPIEVKKKMLDAMTDEQKKLIQEILAESEKGEKDEE